jgi:hypothetical protein
MNNSALIHFMCHCSIFERRAVTKSEMTIKEDDMFIKYINRS